MTKQAEQTSRRMWRLKKGNRIAFAEISNRQVLVDIRKKDARLKGGHIVDVIQCEPAKIREGAVYDVNGGACA